MDRWTQKSFDKLLALLQIAIPNGERFPGPYNTAKKMIKDLGLGYLKIHACEFDCALFRNE